jgi:hypothetical protein
VDLNAAETLAAAEANEHTLITAETHRLHIAAHWADLPFDPERARAPEPWSMCIWRPKPSQPRQSGTPPSRYPPSSAEREC